MKKVLIIAVAILVILIGIIVADEVNKKEESETITYVSTYYENGKEHTTVVEASVKDPNAPVKFTMPISHLDEKDRKNLDAFCKKNNYDSCVINEDKKTFTVTMKAMTHDFMLTNIGMQVIKSVTSVFDSKEYPFVKELGGYNDNFSEITLLVDKESYAKSNNKEDLLQHVASCGIYYQLYTVENQYKCLVMIKDIETKELIDAQTYEQDNYGLKS